LASQLAIRHKEKAHEYSIPGLLLLEYLDQPT